MTIEQAIKHAEEEAENQDKLCKRYDDASGYTRSHNEEIRTSAAKQCEKCADEYRQLAEWLKELKQLREQLKWIPISEELPEDLEAVNITWVNRNPESYYMDIKDKPFTATGHYCKGRWYWYSSTCQDYLKEYGRCDVDEIDTDIEVTAWMPLPKPYEAESEEV